MRFLLVLSELGLCLMFVFAMILEASDSSNILVFVSSLCFWLPYVLLLGESLSLASLPAIIHYSYNEAQLGGGRDGGG